MNERRDCAQQSLQASLCSQTHWLPALQARGRPLSLSLPFQCQQRSPACALTPIRCSNWLELKAAQGASETDNVNFLLWRQVQPKTLEPSYRLAGWLAGERRGEERPVRNFASGSSSAGRRSN